MEARVSGLKDYRPEHYPKALGGCHPTLPGFVSQLAFLNFIGSLAY